MTGDGDGLCGSRWSALIAVSLDPYSVDKTGMSGLARVGLLTA
jgi:hypothetical protein